MAIMSVREGLEFDTVIQSDCASAQRVGGWFVEGGRRACSSRPDARGVASSLNEIASRSGVGMLIRDADVPVQAEVQAACNLLGLDPLYVANEGKLLAIVAPEMADSILEEMYRHPVSEEMRPDHPGRSHG